MCVRILQVDNKLATGFCLEDSFWIKILCIEWCEHVHNGQSNLTDECCHYDKGRTFHVTSTCLRLSSYSILYLSY